MPDDIEEPTPDAPANAADASGHVVLSHASRAALSPAQRADAVVDQWWTDVKASIGPRIDTETHNALFALIPNLKAALVAALS